MNCVDFIVRNVERQQGFVELQAIIYSVNTGIVPTKGSNVRIQGDWQHVQVCLIAGHHQLTVVACAAWWTVAYHWDDDLGCHQQSHQYHFFLNGDLT